MNKASDEKIRVLIADDHGTVREGLRLLINSQDDLEVVGEAADGREAIRLASELSPEVLVMDISMPGLNGLEAAKRVRDLCPQVRVLMLTRHNDDGFLKQLLAAGASGYALKLSSGDELMRAIRTVASSRTYIDPAIAGKLVASAARRTKPGREARVELSEREEQVLRLIAWGYSNKEIAARLNLSVKTIEAHKANAMQKLDMTGRIDIVRYAVLRGWLESPDG